MLALWSLLAGAGPLVDLAPCATPDRWVPVRPVARPAMDDPGERDERDAFGVLNSARSEHFVVRWGPREPTEAQVARLLTAFEDSWSVFVDELDHTRPFGTDTYRFNVYVGDSGGNAPPGFGAAGYYTVDEEGYPYVVVSGGVLLDPGYADITAAHEFYHAIQGSSLRYDYDPEGPAAWFWEASATWAATEVYAGGSYDALGATFLFGYAFLPHRRIELFDYPDSGATQEFHQYGAFVFPLHVADRLEDPMVVRDVWEVGGGGNDPLLALERAIDARGGDLEALWHDHIARNVTWDYPAGEAYREHVAFYEGQLPEGPDLVAARIPPQGTDVWVSGPSRLAPERFGSNTLVLSQPLDTTYTLRLEGEATGSAGTPARWGATVVLDRGDGAPEYLPLDMVDGRAEQVLQDLGDVQQLAVTVGVTTDGRPRTWASETYTYRYRLDQGTGDPGDPDDPDDPADPVAPGDPDEGARVGGCGCDGTGGGAAWLALAGLMALRRRRP
jgi:hypothetical protein